ncbi:beta strand repeat-containing protein [Verrucomicrobiota bacterium sgz303538]
MHNSLTRIARTVVLAGSIATLLTPGARAQLYWDTNGSITGSGTPGIANWDSGTNWTTDSTGAGTSTSWVNGSQVFFSAGSEAAGTWDITLTGPIQTSAITFLGTANTIHNISGGSIDMGTAGLLINATAQGTVGGRSKTIFSDIVGSGGITIAANGDTSATGGSSNTIFALTGANTFLGNVVVTSGVVHVNSNFGDVSNKVILNGGGLVDPNTNVFFTRDLEIGAAGGVIRAYGNTTNFQLAGALTGAGTLRRTDGGTVIINGNASGFTGTFAVDRGTLQIGDGTLTSNPAPNAKGIMIGTDTGAGTFRYNLATSLTLATPVTFANAGSVFAWQGTSASDTLTINNAFGVNTTTGKLRAVSGAITFASGADVKVNELQVSNTPANSASAVMGTMNIGAGASLQTAFFNIGDSNNTGGIVNQTGGTVTIVPGGTGFRLGHWTNGSSPESAYNLSGGTLDASGSGVVVNVGWDGAGTMNVSGTGLLKAQRLYVDAAGVDRPGIVNLQTGGTIEVGAGGTANDGTAGSILNLAGGTLRGVATSTWASKMDANASTTSTIDVVNGSTATVSGVLSGTGALIKTGAGVLNLTATNTYTGAVTVQGGTLLATNAFAPSGTVTVNGGTLATGGNGSTTGLVGALTVNNGGTVLPGTTATDGSIGTLYTPSLTFRGNGRFDLSGGNFTAGGTANDLISVSGAATINGGTITPVFNSTPTAGTYTLVKAAGGLTAASLPTVASIGASRLTFTPTTTATDLQLTVGGSAKTLTWTGASGTWDLTGASNWTDGVQTEKFYQYDSVNFDDTTAGTRSINIVGSLTPGAITVNSSSDYTFTGAGTIEGGGSLTKTGFGALTLANTNNYTGATSISDGKVVVGTGGTTGTLGGTGSIALNFATLAFNRSDDLTLSRAFTGSGGTLEKNGTGKLTIGPSFMLLPQNLVVNSGTLTIQGGSFGGNRLEGSGFVTINAGATLVIPSGYAHAFGGTNAAMTEAFSINGGTLTMNSEQYFNSLMLSGATINGTSDVRASNATNWYVTGTAPSSISNPISPYNAINLTVEDVTNSAAADLTLGGAINNNPGAIQQYGFGTVLYTGTSTAYTGIYHVNGGTLLVSGSITGTATVDVQPGATLGGTGTLGTVAVAGGTIAPGLGAGTAGTLTTGALSLDDFSTIKFELSAAGTVGGANDLLTVNGALTLDGTLVITELPGFTGGTYRLLNYTGALTDNGLNLDAAFLAAHPSALIDLTTPGQVNLFVVPEPGSAVSLAMGLCGLVGLQRFRRRALR